MKFVLILIVAALFTGCSGSKSYHTVKVKKPVYHATWYKKSRWHKKKIGPIRIDLHPFGDKQRAKTVKMRG